MTHVLVSSQLPTNINNTIAAWNFSWILKLIVDHHALEIVFFFSIHYDMWFWHWRVYGIGKTRISLLRPYSKNSTNKTCWLFSTSITFSNLTNSKKHHSRSQVTTISLLQINILGMSEDTYQNTGLEISAKNQNYMSFLKTTSLNNK